MANKRLDYDKIYELVMQCRKSGLSDRQWCLDNDIVPSTFYYWVRRLRQHVCYDLPETEYSGRNVSATERQDVVCVNIQLDPVRETAGIPAVSIPEAANIFLQYGGVSIALSKNFEKQTLKRVLLTLRETVCQEIYPFWIKCILSAAERI